MVDPNTNSKHTVPDLDKLFERMRKRYPEHQPLLEEFNELIRPFITQDDTDTDLKLPELDEALFIQGKAFYPVDTWDVRALKLTSLLEKLESGIAEVLKEQAGELRTLLKLLQDDPELEIKLATLVLERKGEELAKFAEDNKLSTDLVFLVLQSLVQVRARQINRMASPLLEGKSWNHGNCPVCGSTAKFSYISGEGGPRHLVCSQCEHHYRFSRTTCPYCGVDKPENITLHFIEEHKEDRAEACSNCNRFILCSDLRPRQDDVPLAQFLPYGLIHLDIMLMEKGFKLGCAE